MTPQGYPLEVYDPTARAWRPVIGWQTIAARFVPVATDGAGAARLELEAGLAFRIPPLDPFGGDLTIRHELAAAPAVATALVAQGR